MDTSTPHTTNDHKETPTNNTHQHTTTTKKKNAQSRCGGGLSTSRGFFAILGGGSRRFRILLADCRGPSSSHTVSSAVSLQATVGQRLKHPRASIIHKHTIVLFFRIVF